MAAIISTNTLGISNAALANVGLQGDNAATGRSGESIYVNVANGNLVVQRQDELLAARGLDIGVLRTYNSQGQTDGDNNDNWRIGFYRQIKSLTGTVNTTGSTVVRVQEDGAEQKFAWNGSIYVSTDGDDAYDTLAWNSGTSQWTYTNGSSRTTEAYDWSNGSGKLLNQADAAGNKVTYTYNTGLLSRVTSANSGATQFNYTDLSYDTSNNLTSVTNSAWDVGSGSNKTITRVSYTYETWTGGSRLKTVTVDLTPDNAADSSTYVTSYTYVSNSSTLLATLAQSDGTSLAFTYNGTRLASITDALGNATVYSYDSSNTFTTVTDALNNVTTYSYDGAGRLTSISGPAAGGVASTTSYSWNANGDLIQVTNGEGKRTVMQYDANGNLVLQRDEAGNTVTRTYDGNNQLTAETVYAIPDPDGADPSNGNAMGAPGGAQTTRYVYNNNVAGQLRFMISPEGRVTEYRYDANGLRVAAIQYRGTLYTGTASTEGSLQSWVSSNSTDKTQCLRTDYAYDFRGQIASSTAWGSVDANGNGVTYTSYVTNFVYGPNGQLLKTVAPQGGTDQTTTYTYDGLGRLLTASNGLNQTTSSSYDAANNRTTITAANGLSTVNSYDAAGRLVSVQRSAPSVGTVTTRYYYDADNQLRMTRDPNGINTWNLYDAAGRMVATIDGNGSMTETVYDRNDRVVKTIA